MEESCKYTLKHTLTSQEDYLKLVKDLQSAYYGEHSGGQPKTYPCIVEVSDHLGYTDVQYHHFAYFYQEDANALNRAREQDELLDR